jgi:fumarate hydratase class II
MDYREESDSLGTVRVPADAYYGAQTRRAAENFSISNLAFHPLFLRSLALIKRCAARVNQSLGLIDEDRADAVARAAQEVMDGRHTDQFPVDVFQTGSGTSTNMNVNEVIATRANEILTGERRTTRPVHPNDHVNRSQSTNDVFPSAIHMAALSLVRGKLLPSLELLQRSLQDKAGEFADIRKVGRTHLQDAVIMTLGEEFSGYAAQMARAGERIRVAGERLAYLALGGTAVGNGLNAPPGFAGKTIAMIGEETGLPFAEAPNHFEAQGACDTAVEAGAALKTAAVGLIKIADDVRWLASGPRCGLGEINLPELQPGSSIMPGKVNPVVPEAVILAGVQVAGNDATLGLCGQKANFELAATLPLVAYTLLQSIEILANGADLMARKCIRGITANRERCEGNIRRSLAVVTNLTPSIGYDRAAAIAARAHEEGRTIEEVALAENIMPEQELRRVLYGESGS